MVRDVELFSAFSKGGGGGVNPSKGISLFGWGEYASGVAPYRYETQLIWMICDNNKIRNSWFMKALPWLFFFWEAPPFLWGRITNTFFLYEQSTFRDVMLLMDWRLICPPVPELWGYNCFRALESGAGRWGSTELLIIAKSILRRKLILF